MTSGRLYCNHETKRQQSGRRQSEGCNLSDYESGTIGLSARHIADRIGTDLGPVPESSIRSYLSLKTPHRFIRESRGVYRFGGSDGADFQRPLFEAAKEKPLSFGRTVLFHDNAFDCHSRLPLPRFTTLTDAQKRTLRE